MRTIQGKEGWRALVGQEIGVSDWLEVTQERVEQFAEATGDHQWIHVNPVRAAAESPFGGTIAHGYLTLSLGPTLLGGVLRLEGFRMAINYGLNKLRFPAPLRVGGRVRLRVHALGVEDVEGGAGIQATLKLTFEVEGQDKPACVAETLFRYYV
jgi:acyl dehydratase